MTTQHPFPTTSWNMIRAAQEAGADQTEALNQFMQDYWRPVYCYFRAKRERANRAEDLTQEFFLKMVDRNWLAKASPRRGRLRSLLMTMLKRFYYDQTAKLPKAQQFEKEFVKISMLSSGDQSFDPPIDCSPEEVFDRQWALSVAQKVQSHIKLVCVSEGNEYRYRIFKRTKLPSPGEQKPTQDQLATEYGITREQVRYAITVVEDMFGEFLRKEIAAQVESPHDIEREIQLLSAYL